MYGICGKKLTETVEGYSENENPNRISFDLTYLPAGKYCYSATASNDMTTIVVKGVIEKCKMSVIPSKLANVYFLFCYNTVIQNRGNTLATTVGITVPLFVLSSLTISLAIILVTAKCRRRKFQGNTLPTLILLLLTTI